MKRKPFLYPRAGYFSELVYLHGFPPLYQPQALPKNEAARQRAGQKSRAAQLANGHTGSIAGLSKKGDECVRSAVVRARARSKCNGVGS